MAETLDHRGVPASSDGSLRDHPNIFDMFPSNFPEGLRVLVFDEDPSYLLILETHLQEFQCKVTACNEEKKAMYLLRNHTNMFDIAMIQVNNSDGDRFRFLSKIGSEMDIPIIIISEDDSHQSVIKWMSNGASDYLIKPIRPEELPIIFIKHVVKKLLGRRSVVTGGEAEEKAAGEKSSSVGDSTIRNPNKRKRSICLGAEVNEEDHHDDDPACASSSKKRRVVWSGELHQKFLEAVKYLGIGKAVPKKILEIMNVEGITRENIASHLQKHRIGLQKQKENDKIKREETNLSLILPQEGTMYVGEDPSNIYRGIRNVQCPTHHHTNNIPQPLYVPQKHTTNPNNLRTHLIPPLGHQLDGVSIANLMMNHQYQNHLQTPDFTTQENYAYNNNFNEDEPIATNFYFTAPNLEDLTLHLQDLAHEAAPSPRFPLSSISPSYTHSSNLDQRESGGFSSNSSFM